MFRNSLVKSKAKHSSIIIWLISGSLNYHLSNFRISSDVQRKGFDAHGHVQG